MTDERIYWMEAAGKRSALHERSMAEAFEAIRNVVPTGTVISCTGVQDVAQDIREIELLGA